jgi:propionate CoA-transferase
MFITERAVFKLEPAGLVLQEIAPGIHLQRDILDRMDFVPILAEEIKVMDKRIFRKSPMGLLQSLT